MSDRKYYTADDAIRDEAGRWKIEFICPLNGPQCLSGIQPSWIAESINQLLDHAWEAKEAIEPYRKGVKALTKLALEKDDHRSAVAATVLLSTYMSEFELKLTDLFRLDRTNFEHVVAVIRGRLHCVREPQYMIDDGIQTFNKIIMKWGHLKTIDRQQDHSDEDQKSQHIETNRIVNAI